MHFDRPTMDARCIQMYLDQAAQDALMDRSSVLGSSHVHKFVLNYLRLNHPEYYAKVFGSILAGQIVLIEE